MTIYQAKDELVSRISSIANVWGAGVIKGPDDRLLIEVALKGKEAFENVLTNVLAFSSLGGISYQGFPVSVRQTDQPVTYNDYIAPVAAPASDEHILNEPAVATTSTSSVTPASSSRFKTSVTEKTAIITGVEILMGVVEAIVVVNLINLFRRLPLKVPSAKEMFKMVGLLALTGMIGGALSANIIERIRTNEAKAKAIAENGTEPASFTGKSFASPYRVPAVPTGWMTAPRLPK